MTKVIKITKGAEWWDGNTISRLHLNGGFPGGYWESIYPILATVEQFKDKRWYPKTDGSRVKHRLYRNGRVFIKYHPGFKTRQEAKDWVVRSFFDWTREKEKVEPKLETQKERELRELHDLII